MDPAPSIYDLDQYETPKGGQIMKGDILSLFALMVIWDLARSVLTAWITKLWLTKKPKRKKRTAAKRNRRKK